MFRITLSVIVFILTVTVLASAAGADRISQIRIKPMTKQQYLDMLEMGMDIRRQPGQEFDAFANPSDIQKLRQKGIGFDVIHDDVQEFYVSRAEEADFGGFMTLAQIETYLDDLAAAHPTIMTSKYSIGLTIEWRNQWVVKVSDNPGVDEDEPEVFYNSLIHAREPAGAAALLYFLEYLVANYGTDPEVTYLVDNRELFFCPVANPDGYYYNEEIAPNGGGMWRKNRRENYDGSYGVDLNRNWGEKWGYDNLGSSPVPNYETYRGTAGFSEPETENLRNFIVSRDFTIVHNFHTYSNLELWSPSYDRFFDLRQEYYANLGDTITQYNNYTPGVGWTLYPTNGDSDDWIWGDTLSKPAIISLTVEIGSSSDGFWPSPSRIPILCEQNLYPNLYLAQIADNPYAIAPPLVPQITSPEESTGDYTVAWTLDDTDNPAVTYRLMEYSDRQEVVDNVEADYGYWDAVFFSRSTDRDYTGSYSWHNVLNYDGFAWLQSRTPYEVKTGDMLRMWLWYDIEAGWDYFYAQVSTDGGLSFENLAGDYTTNDDPNGMNHGNGITGSSGIWVLAPFDLTPYEGQQVIFRLSYITDDYYYEEGVYIDDIERIEIFNTVNQVSSSITDGFYNFTGKANGEYWYSVAATDAEGQEGYLSKMTHTVVANTLCCVISGDINHDGFLDPLDVTYFVNWLWKSGSDIACLEEADLNGDLEVDPLDLTYLVNYIWKGGPAPAGCHPLQ
ncbi:MAG: M14 family zinc carboxypeptidase [Candidatus Zixiibacteriota bacterium]